MKNRFFGAFAAFFLLSLAPHALWAEEFQFLYQKGQKFRYQGVNNQTVTVNNRPFNTHQSLQRVTFEVFDTAGKKGFLKGNIQFLDEYPGVTGASQLKAEYPADFWRDEKGLFDIEPQMLMPIVRNVPTFPAGDVKIGQKWSAPGQEVHDLRRDFQIPQPLKVPIEVNYEYLGDKVVGERHFKQFTAAYNIYHKTGFRFPKLALYPVLMTGFSHQRILWDSENGRPDSYEEDYSLVFVMNTGDVYEFSGDANSSVVEAQEMDKPSLAGNIKKDLENKGLPNVDVRTSDKGVVLNLDNINFPADSAVLVPTEQDKLRLIADILKNYPERDILVEGHTALAGRADERQALSETRAAAVGNFLLSLGVRKVEQITFRGWGSSKPIADNLTTDGMKKNRRVEITILEN